ncbi:hypothetical protein QYE76_063711 [Lolium multiflorum]|uniref:Uncharacterized protein n=1 Tax=Lolium multiflorum TaxID=4521 RepID=A0AAD8S540_LOLMU|nr:hypothetical protein QYE76_063711 [Lolium multiflorum]
MENYSLLMVMKMAVVSMEKPSGALPVPAACRNRDSCPPDLGFAMAAALEGFAYRGLFEFRPVKAKAASLPPGVTAERCWCGRLAKVKQVEDFSDWFGIKFFMCANYDHDPPPSSASSSTRPPSPPPLCKWFHWIDKEQLDWARKEVEEKHRRAWARFFEEERWEKARANEKAERERRIQKLRTEQARNREVNQKRMDDEAVGMQRMRCAGRPVKRKRRD